MKPTIDEITRRGGVAGQVAYDVTVTHPADDGPLALTLTGQEGQHGPVVLSVGPRDNWVTEPSRFGAFDIEWVYRFFGADR